MAISSLTVELIGASIGLVGLVSSFYFYRRSVEKPRPCYGITSIPLIGGSSPLLPSEVKVSYCDEQVKSLVKTYVLFWNGGTKTLNSADVAETDPIRIVLDDRESRILRSRVTRATRVVSRVSVGHDESDEYDGSKWETEAAVTFSFLDPGDGFIVEILHTGDDTKVGVKGTIKGIPNGMTSIGYVKSLEALKISGGKLWRMDLLLPRRIARITFYPAIIFSLLALSSPLLPNSFFTRANDPSLSRWGGFIMGIVWASFVISVLWANRRRIPKPLRLDPSDLIG